MVFCNLKFYADKIGRYLANFHDSNGCLLVRCSRIFCMDWGKKIKLIKKESALCLKLDLTLLIFA